MDYDDLAIPAFLDRKVNGLAPTTPEELRIAKQMRREPKIVWPKKRNWRKIEARRLAREKREGTAIRAGAIVARRGQ